jgi:hypothetical protein
MGNVTAFLPRFHQRLDVGCFELMCTGAIACSTGDLI